MNSITTITNLILRVENSKEQPHEELESAGNPNLKIWIKDYDVWPNNNDNVFSFINDAIRIASKIKNERKFIHISLEGSYSTFSINSAMLRKIGDSGCTLEIYIADE